MNKIFLITGFFLLSFYGHSQTIDEIAKMKSADVKQVLDSLPTMCNIAAEGWINSQTENPLRKHNNSLKVIHIGSLEDNASRQNMEILNKLQRQLPQITFLLVGNSTFDFPSSENDYSPILRQNNIALPFLPDSIYKRNPCAYANSEGPVTLVLTPDNHIIQTYSGALNIDFLASDLIRIRDILLVFYKINPAPFLGKTPRQFSKTTIIECPTGIAVDALNERIFISDYCANRVLVLSPFGELLDVIGTGKAGNKNGSLNQAQLNGPRGLAYDEKNEILYVADSRNNCIKQVNLKTAEIETIKTSEYFNQPENLTLASGQLFIVAKSAIWKMNTESRVFEVVYNDIVSASANKMKQAAGISVTDDGIIILTDNLASAVKYIENGEVNSPTASGEFGFMDGKKDDVRFYYPNGIAQYDDGFLIADTYNNRIRWYDPFKRKSKTIAGSGDMGINDGNALKASFNSPHDIAILNNRAYITDLGSGLIKILDLGSGIVTNMSVSNYSILCFGYSPPIKDFRYGDSLLVSNTEENISLKINLTENYEIDKEGFSQANTSTRSKNIKITDSEMNDQTIEFTIESDQASENLLVEYILFFKSKLQPELKYKRTVALLFPIIFSPEIDSNTQKFEFTFDPDSEE